MTHTYHVRNTRGAPIRRREDIANEAKQANEHATPVPLSPSDPQPWMDSGIYHANVNLSCTYGITDHSHIPLRILHGSHDSHRRPHLHSWPSPPYTGLPYTRSCMRFTTGRPKYQGASRIRTSSTVTRSLDAAYRRAAVYRRRHDAYVAIVG